MNRFLLFDPGLINFKSALRGTLAVVLSFFAMSSLAQSFHQPSSLAFVAVIVAMMSSLTVSDATQAEQKRTFFFMILPAAAGFALCVLAEPWPALRVVGFLSITFMAVYARRFGPRGSSLGMVSYMAYFCPLFFPVHQGAMAYGVLAVIVGIAFSYAFRFWILRERTVQDLRLYHHSYRGLILDVMTALSDELLLLANTPPGEQSAFIVKSRVRLQKKLNRVTELSLNLDQFLTGTGSADVRGQFEELQMHFFEKELSLRHVLDTVSQAIIQWENERRLNPDVLRSLAGLIQNATIEIASSAPVAGEGGRSAELAVFEKPLRRLIENERARYVLRKGSFVAAVSETRKAAIGTSLHVNTRQAIQSTLATALASAAGVALSSTRWYWAAVTAFVIFSGATRGETFQRAFLRVLGTVGGLVLGFSLAYLLSGHHALEWGVVILTVFVAIFAAKSTMGFWTAGVFTLMLAILYDILGQLTEQILMLRLEETVIGAVIGAIVAAFVIPISTRAAVRDSLAVYLDSVARALDELSKKVSSPFARRDLLRRLREVDRDLATLRSSAAPIVGKLSIVRGGDIPGVVHEASVLAHFLRHLATYTGPIEVLTPEDVVRRCDRLAMKAHILSDHLKKKSASPVSRLSLPPWPNADGDIPSHWFSRMEQILGSLREASFFQDV
jgi:hypothetical protein